MARRLLCWSWLGLAELTTSGQAVPYWKQKQKAVGKVEGLELIHQPVAGADFQVLHLAACGPCWAGAQICLKFLQRRCGDQIGVLVGRPFGHCCARPLRSEALAGRAEILHAVAGGRCFLRLQLVLRVVQL